MDPAIRNEWRQKWYEDEVDMRKLFHKGAELSYLEGLIDLETRNKYHLSMSDMQLVHGTEEIPDPQNKCVLFLRNIVDLKNYISDPKAAQFADIFYNEKAEQYEIDVTAAHLLKEMIARGKQSISDKNTSSFEVLWRYDDFISPELHKDYLNKLSDQFVESMRTLIDSSVNNNLMEYQSELHEESHSHWLRCKGIVGEFIPRSEVGNVVSYLSGNDCHPLFIHGVPGSGKTTLLSKIAAEV